jgi:hypothetical protein
MLRVSGPRPPSGRSAASTGHATVAQIVMVRLASVAAARWTASTSAVESPSPGAGGSATNTTSTSLT